MANVLGTGANDILLGDTDPLLPNDVLNSSWFAGDDQMVGGNGDDTYNVNSAGDLVTEGNGAVSGIDTVKSQVVSYTLTANVENLVLQEQDRSGVLVGGIPIIAISLGAPTAVTGWGNTLANTLTGNSNGNYLYGLDGNDTVFGNAGNDWLFGGNGNDSLDGGDGNDLLWGENNNDTMSGGAGTDTFYGGSGNDSMIGGAGNDTFYVDQIGDVVVEASVFVSVLPPGTDTVYASITETLDANVENLTLTGITSLNGTGNSLNNLIKGNVGNNTLDGKAGADTMEGSTGNDTYLVDNAGDVVNENAASGTDTVKSSVTFTLADVDVENLTLTGTTAINGTGNASANTLNGNSANNVLKGLAADDNLFGKAGDDTIEGGFGSDDIHGGLGIDTLRAAGPALGVDDGVEDRFRFDTTPDGTTNWDLIDTAIFNGVEGLDDEIELDDTIFTGLSMSAGGSLNEYYEGSARDGHLVTDPTGIYLDIDTGCLYYNPTFNVADDNELIAVINDTIPAQSESLSGADIMLV